MSRERLPWYQALPLGLQHFLSMFGATVLVPMLMGFSPSVSVMCSGIGTALYLVATKGKIPSYLGPSFSFVGPVVIASATAGVAGVGSAIVGAGLVFVVCALVVRKTERAGSIDSFHGGHGRDHLRYWLRPGYYGGFGGAHRAPRADAVADARCGGVAPSSWSCCARAFGKVLNTIPSVLAGAAVAYGLSCAFGMVGLHPWLRRLIGLPDSRCPSSM